MNNNNKTFKSAVTIKLIKGHSPIPRQWPLELLQAGTMSSLGETLAYLCVFFVAPALGRILALWGPSPGLLP